MSKVEVGYVLEPQEDPKAMTALLRVMVLCGASPPELVALLLPADRLVAAQNAEA
jgi:hypothetical protein